MEFTPGVGIPGGAKSRRFTQIHADSRSSGWLMVKWLNGGAEGGGRRAKGVAVIGNQWLVISHLKEVDG